jgi:hypothetical protein
VFLEDVRACHRTDPKRSKLVTHCGTGALLLISKCIMQPMNTYSVRVVHVSCVSAAHTKFGGCHQPQHVPSSMQGAHAENKCTTL